MTKTNRIEHKRELTSELSSMPSYITTTRLKYHLNLKYSPTDLKSPQQVACLNL